METIERYGVFEWRGQACMPPEGTFTYNGHEWQIGGFQISETEYAIRFMPMEEGAWQYKIVCGGVEHAGKLVCVANTGSNHGPVLSDGMGFRYADGKKFYPMGTTCYAWTHQHQGLIDQTLNTLAGAPFNKVRMCLFPKSMPYNNNDPDRYPFVKDTGGKWDVKRPDFAFWAHFEGLLTRLQALGIEADIILFHPYDRWGFADFDTDDCLVYLDYCIRRLSAYRNLWWSLANEYDLVPVRTREDWDLFGKKLQRDDPCGHLISIHNCFAQYPKCDWMTHCSIQTKDVNHVVSWGKKYQLPIVIDESCYEGNIEFEWGNISGFELVHRAWITVVGGGYFTHGETFWRKDEVLWWAKGGQLYGKSPERLAFLKDLQYEVGELDPDAQWMYMSSNLNLEAVPPQAKTGLKAILALSDEERYQCLLNSMPQVGRNQDHRLQYMGRHCPAFADMQLPEDGLYRIEVIDVWEMTRNTVMTQVSGKVKIPLPGKEGIAVLVTRLSGEML